MIKEELIFLNKKFETKGQVFEFLAETCEEFNISDSKEAVFDELNNRENQGTTGMMDGFAIPHAKSENINNVSVIVIKNDHGISWESMDGEDIDFIIGMFIPENEKGSGHLNLLSQIAKMLMKSDAKEKLKKSDSVDKIKEVLLNNIN